MNIGLNMRVCPCKELRLSHCQTSCYLRLPFLGTPLVPSRPCLRQASRFGWGRASERRACGGAAAVSLVHERLARSGGLSGGLSGGPRRAASVNVPLLRLQSSEGKFASSREIGPVRRRSYCRHGSCTFTEVARLVHSGLVSSRLDLSAATRGGKATAAAMRELPVTRVYKQTHSFYRSLLPAVEQQKLLSSPRFGVFQTTLPTRPVLRGMLSSCVSSWNAPPGLLVIVVGLDRDAGDSCRSGCYRGRSGLPAFGRRYLPNSTCLKRARLLYALLVVSRSIMIFYIHRHCLKNTCVRQVVLDKWFPATHAALAADLVRAPRCAPDNRTSAFLPGTSTANTARKHVKMSYAYPLRQFGHFPA